jgi:hypothetical protein
MLVRCYEDNINYDELMFSTKAHLNGVVDADRAYRVTVSQLKMIFRPPLSKLFNVVDSPQRHLTLDTSLSRPYVLSSSCIADGHTFEVRFQTNLTI